MLSLNNFQGCLKGWMQIKQESTEVVTSSRSLHFCNLKQKGRSAQTEFRRGLWIKDFKHTDQHLIHVRATHVKCLQVPNIIYSMFATPTYIQVFLLDIWNRGKCIYITKEILLHLLNAIYPFLSKGVNIVSSHFNYEVLILVSFEHWTTPMQKTSFLWNWTSFPLVYEAATCSSGERTVFFLLLQCSNIFIAKIMFLNFNSQIGYVIYYMQQIDLCASRSYS